MDGIFSLQEDQILECARLYVRVFNAEPWSDNWTEETAYKRLRDVFITPNFYGLVNVVDGRIVGSILGVCEQWYEGQHYNLKEMFVDNEDQGKGIGTMLIHELTEQLRSRDVNTVILFTSRGNNTHNFYLKNDFVELESMAMMAKGL